MRSHTQNSVDNALSKMFKTNRNYIQQEISRYSSAQAMEPGYRRNDIFNFGALQIDNYLDSPGYMIVGAVSASPVVGI